MEEAMLDKFQTRLTRRTGMALLTLIGLVALFEEASVATDKVDLLFVQSAPDIAVIGDELRLKNISPLTLFFSDRPQRIVGHFNLDEWQKLWLDGRDSMQKNHPNAVLSVFEPGKKDPSETAVELLDMKSDGADLVYSIKVLKGTPPSAGGQGSLFIDDMPVSSFDQVEARDCYRHGCADF
jgi:hypothetical protein